MADLPLSPLAPELRARLARVFDVEGKIPRALEALGPIAGRDVVLLDADVGLRALQLASLGARVTALAPAERLEELRAGLGAEVPGTVAVATGEARGTGLSTGSADVVVSLWSAFRGGTVTELREAERILRPGGRLLVLHDYGRDDVSRFMAERVAHARLAWSRRDGWFLTHDFKIRVIHAWWTFPDRDAARGVLSGLFGEAGASFADGLGRLRLSHKLVVYHRDRLAGAGKRDAA